MIFAALIFGLAARLFLPIADDKRADLIVINAKVRTMTAKRPRAEAIAVKGNRIIIIGKTRQVRTLVGKETKVIDAQGRLVLPGFNDAHVHFMGIGNMFSSIDLRDARSPHDVAAKIEDYTNFLPKGRWILGGQWNNENWTPSDLPTRQLIDRVTRDHPVFIYHSDAKTALSNSIALRLARISKDTKEISGGEIVRDSAGEPTGILRGKAMDLVRAMVPASHTRDWLAIAETATNYAASLGVTSLQDMDTDDQAVTYRELEGQKKLKTRIYDCVWLENRQKYTLIDASLRQGLVRQGCLKSKAEGDPGWDSGLEAKVVDADKAGWQVMLHAIGPTSIVTALRAFEHAAVKNEPRDRRFRIEHAHNARAEDIRRFRESGVIASVQPYLFSGSVGRNYRAMLDNSVTLAFGSDASITDLNPLLGIYAAVSNGNSKGNRIGKGLSIYEAVRAYTYGSAYAESQEKTKGTLEPGKLADFVILSDDIFAINPAKIPEVKVVLTVLDGQVVYDAR